MMRSLPANEQSSRGESYLFSNSGTPQRPPPMRVPSLTSNTSANQGANELNTLLAAAAASKAHQQAAGGMEWVVDPAYDSTTAESIRFTAALVLRNLGKLQHMIL